MNNNRPEWKIPQNLPELIAEDENETWESDRWDPIILTVMGGTSYEGRDIALSWQILFDPFDEPFAQVNKKLENENIEPDGYSWTNLIFEAFNDKYPELFNEIRDDSEHSTCVIWTESEEVCKKLMQVTWSLVFQKI